MSMCVCAYVHMCIFVYVCMSICVFVYRILFAYAYMGICVYVYVCIPVYANICTCVCVYTCIDVYLKASPLPPALPCQQSTAVWFLAGIGIFLHQNCHFL